jgi:hypothetical protein
VRTATPLTAWANDVTTVASGTGVELPSAIVGEHYHVCNDGANSLLVYPTPGGQIDNGQNNAVAVPVAQCSTYFAFSSNSLRTVAAFSGGSLQPAFYVAPTGSDSNAGTLAAPFATLDKCRVAMEGSTIQTCYIRAGTYNLSSAGTCNVSDSGTTCTQSNLG